MDMDQTSRGYRRGAIMGLTIAEAFILIAFALLLLFAFWQWMESKKNTPEVQVFRELPYDQRQTVLSASRDGSLEAFVQVFKELPYDQRQRVISASTDGSLEAFVALVEQGVDFSRPGSLEDPSERWRFIDRDEVLRLTDAATRLPEDIQRDLADMVESDRAQEILKEMAVLEELVGAGQKLESISRNIRDAEAQKDALVGTLRRELGGVASGVGGTIDDNGTITLPDTILFEQGQSNVTPRMAGFLEKFCEPWLEVLKNSGANIYEARIEGHSSSEWYRGASPQQAYLGNLYLSQRRAAVISRACLGHVKDPETLEWARKHMVATGYSSGRPVMRNGREDTSASRRVVFSVVQDRETLLEDIDAAASASYPNADPVDREDIVATPLQLCMARNAGAGMSQQGALDACRLEVFRQRRGIDN
ncbi:MAG: hypothetical protein GDA35_07600 [Hyphomonadaceae bacterium]|nr:hypothetical protein [Hyphomonadaceae bacterium]